MNEQTIEQRLEALLAVVAEQCRPCHLCQQLLYFVRHQNGEQVPYTADGLNHFFHCPSTQRLRKGRMERGGQQPLMDIAPIPD